MTSIGTPALPAATPELIRVRRREEEIGAEKRLGLGTDRV
jgi:hypothetical protein